MNLALVYFDLETGGLSRERHPIIQLAACATDAAGEIVAEFEQKIAFDPARATQRALRMNHFQAVDWLGAQGERAVLEEFSAWLQPYCTIPKTSKNGETRLLAQLGGHNAGGFDLPFLQTAYRRCKLPFPADYHVFDTVAAAHLLTMLGAPRPKSYKLVDLCASFGVEIDKAHDALGDVRATAKLAKALTSRLQLVRA
jgi:DNA polymerase III alpha subunit (gram-positive type)